MRFTTNIVKTNKEQNISDWYLEVIEKANLASYGPAKGTMIIKPYGYALWESIQKFMDKKFKDKGIENCYFPLLIPYSLLQKEKDHVEGFAPECAIVTIGGGEELEDKLIVRPTSETIMYQEYAKIIKSHRDLPLLWNQWNNVVRWEKRTYPFLRTSEFLWQEGHTVHSSHEEALEYVLWALNVYKETYEELLGITGIQGWKSQSEKFAGAYNSSTIELMMPSGKALQGCTSHDLGDNFSKVFDIKYQDKNNTQQYAWQTSFGFTTRSIGAMIMSHGDNHGLVLPPEIAPIQLEIIVIKDIPELVAQAENIHRKCLECNIRSKINYNFEEFLSDRIYQNKLTGIPMTLILGERELENATRHLYTCEDRFGEVHKGIKIEDISNILRNIQNKLLINSQQFVSRNIHQAKDYNEFKEILEKEKGFIEVFWNEDKEIEKKIKEETKATSRCRPLNQQEEEGIDFITGEKSKTKWLFSIAY